MGPIPVSTDVLRRAEEEIASPASVRGSSRHLAGAEDPSTPRAGPLGVVSQRYATPIRRIPSIVIEPASTRPTQNASPYSDEEELRLWTKDEWKRLEQCLLGERKSVADARGVDAGMVDVGDVNVDDMVRKFLNQERLVGDPEDWEGEGEWSR